MAYDADFLQAPIRSAVLDELLHGLPQGPCTALDAGTGSGRALERLIQNLHPDSEIVGCDIAPRMLDAVAKRIEPSHAGRYTLVEADNAALPFESGSFDIVVSTFTIHHVPPSRQLRVLQEFRRILAARGILLLADQIQPEPPLDRTQMRAAVAETFYPYLSRGDALRKLSEYGEWPLGTDEFTTLLGRAGFRARVVTLSRIVAAIHATPTTTLWPDLSPHQAVRRSLCGARC